MIGALTMGPFAAVELQTRAVHFTPGVFAGIAYVTIFPSLIAYFMFNKAVAEIGAGDAGQVINLQPLFGAILYLPHPWCSPFTPIISPAWR